MLVYISTSYNGAFNSYNAMYLFSHPVELWIEHAHSTNVKVTFKSHACDKHCEVTSYPTQCLHNLYTCFEPFHKIGSMGKVMSSAARVTRNYNIENRAQKAIETQMKTPKVAPAYPSTQESLRKIKDGMQNLHCAYMLLLMVLSSCKMIL